MAHRLEACLVALVIAVPGVGLAQQGTASAPLQRGVNVRMAVTQNAVEVPDADEPQALVVTVAADGTTFLQGDPVVPSNLAAAVKDILVTRSDSTLYIKADAGVPYARVVEVLDAVQTSGVEGITLLTTQQDPADRGKQRVFPKGLAMRIVR